MAAYRRVDDLLTACTLGSAPGPTLGVEYGKVFTFNILITSCFIYFTIYRKQVRFLAL